MTDDPAPWPPALGTTRDSQLWAVSNENGPPMRPMTGGGVWHRPPLPSDAHPKFCTNPPRNQCRRNREQTLIAPIFRARQR
jgi:hypothetical protein